MQHRPSKEWQLLQPVVEAMGYEFVGCERLKHDRQQILRVYIDTPQGADIDDCEKVSHQISGVLDVEDPLNSRYILEVSSPGIDRPLFKIEDFERWIGETVKLKLAVAVNNRRNFRGIVIATDDRSIVLDVDQQQYTIPFTSIDKAKLVPDYTQLEKYQP